MNILSVVVACNFPHYLRNAVESLVEFFPWGEVLVVDNGAHASVRVYLEEATQRHARVEAVHSGGNDNARKVGSLYAAYNLAIERAIAGGYDYVQLVQDDMQFVWTDRGLPERVEALFETDPTASILSPVFMKGVDPRADLRYTYLPARHLYRSRDYALSDVGIVPVQLFERTGIRYGGSNETGTSEMMRAKGFVAYAVHDPFLAYVPWPAIRRFGRIRGRERSPVRRYYIKPLTDEQIRRLTSREAGSLAFHEDYCFPWGYRCLTPYLYSDFPAEYFADLRERRWARGRPEVRVRLESRGLDGPTGTRVDPPLRKVAAQYVGYRARRMLGAYAKN